MLDINTFFLYNVIGDNMDKLNNKGFTLVEVLAVVVIIAVLGGIAIPGVMSAMETGKKSSKKAMIENIKTASQELYEELYYMDGTLYRYNGNTGNKTNETIGFTDQTKTQIEVNL